MRASSCHQISIGVPAGRRAWSAASSSGKFFKSLKRKLVLAVVTGPRRQAPKSHGPQFAAHGGFCHLDTELLVEPAHEIFASPAYHAMNRRDRPTLHNLRQCMTLLIVEPRHGAQVPCGRAIPRLPPR